MRGGKNSKYTSGVFRDTLMAMVSLHLASWRVGFVVRFNINTRTLLHAKRYCKPSLLFLLCSLISSFLLFFFYFFLFLYLHLNHFFFHDLFITSKLYKQICQWLLRYFCLPTLVLFFMGKIVVLGIVVSACCLLGNFICLQTQSWEAGAFLHKVFDFQQTLNYC